METFIISIKWSKHDQLVFNCANRSFLDHLIDMLEVSNLLKNQDHQARSKHIDVKYHYIREITYEDGARLKKISIKDNPMDMLTKVVPVSKFKHCSDLI